MPTTGPHSRFLALPLSLSHGGDARECYRNPEVTERWWQIIFYIKYYQSTTHLDDGGQKASFEVLARLGRHMRSELPL